MKAVFFDAGGTLLHIDYARVSVAIRDVLGHAPPPEAFIAEWEAGGPPLPAAERQRMLAYDYEALMLVAQDRESLEDVPPAMTMPCLYYVGDKDEVYPLARQAAERMPNVTFVTLPGLDHIEVIGRLDLVVPRILAFLRALDAPACT